MASHRVASKPTKTNQTINNTNANNNSTNINDDINLFCVSAFRSSVVKKVLVFNNNSNNIINDGEAIDDDYHQEKSQYAIFSRENTIELLQSGVFDLLSISLIKSG